MSGDLGERIASLESLTKNNSAAHDRMSDKMDRLLNVTTKISSTQDNIAGSLRRMNNSINEHDDRLRSLENSRLTREAEATLLRRMIYAAWTLIIAVAGFFGFHFFGTPNGPTH